MWDCTECLELAEAIECNEGEPGIGLSSTRARIGVGTDGFNGRFRLKCDLKRPEAKPEGLNGCGL